MSRHKRIALLGNRAMAIEIGEYLHAQEGVEMLIVLNPDDDGRDRGQALSLSKRAADWGVRTIQPKGLRKPAQIALLADFDPDLILSCSYARIIPQTVIDLGREGCLNIHFADLPKNRGCLPVVWTLALGAPDLVATLHEITPGIDDGPILMQARSPVSPGTTAEIATGICAKLGAGLFKTYFDAWMRGDAPSAVVQDESVVTYHTMVHPYDRYPPVWLNPTRVANTINALTFPPHPAARLNQSNADDELVLRGPAKPVDGYDGGPIGMISKTDDGWIVVCQGGAVLFSALETDDGQPVLTDGPFFTDVTPVPEYAP